MVEELVSELLQNFNVSIFSEVSEELVSLVVDILEISKSVDGSIDVSRSLSNVLT